MGGGINDTELLSCCRRLAAVGGVWKVIVAINPNFLLCHDALQQPRVAVVVFFFSFLTLPVCPLPHQLATTTTTLCLSPAFCKPSVGEEKIIINNNTTALSRRQDKAERGGRSPESSEQQSLPLDDGR